MCSYLFPLWYFIWYIDFFFCFVYFFFFLLFFFFFFFFFFFSSRRRHTRCGRDWSSDVCSSDLFLSTSGGSYELEGNRLTEWVEFDSDNPEAVGTEISSILRITDSEIVFLEGHMKVKRIDDGTLGALQGAWLMSGRTIDGDTQIRDTNTPRKTMKILSGTRFQWIAYNTETKQFMATGGGTYTTKDGKYTEKIEFFSRDKIGRASCRERV